jgi:hypothetical protein
MMTRGDLMKPWYASSTFWLTQIANVLGGLTVAGAFECPAGCSPTMQAVVRIAGLATVLLASLGYGKARTEREIAVTNPPALSEALKLYAELHKAIGKDDPMGATVPAAAKP